MEDEFNLQVLKEKIKAKEYIDKKFFNIFNKIENSNSINVLIYIQLDLINFQALPLKKKEEINWYLIQTMLSFFMFHIMKI